MSWKGRRGRHRGSPGAAAVDPVVLAVTQPLTRATVDSLASQVQRLAPETPVVIDLTAIPSFDSDGAMGLSGLQERERNRQVTIVGLRQAAARLTGATTVPVGPTTSQGWVVRRLHNLAVVQAADDVPPVSADTLEAPLTEASNLDVGIVVCDLRGVSLTDHAATVLAFASSTAAVRGQELLVVNVDAADLERLRQIGLSATTYVAPET
jgi:anti-anti-sigma regulatory factor